MIWYCTTKELMKSYSERSVKDLEHTNYIIISSRIVTTKSHDNVFNATNFFLQSGSLKGTRFSEEPGSISSKEKFKSFLLQDVKSMGFLCSLIECSVLENEDSIFICSPNEMDVGYMQVIAETIYTLFQYPVLRYPDSRDIDLKEVITRLVYYKEENLNLRIRTSTGPELETVLKKLDKEKLKSILKERRIYQKGMSKREMIETIIDTN